MTDLTDRQREQLALHFDPTWGAPYWQDKLRQRGLDPAREFASSDDLWLLGPMDEVAMRTRPIADFIPRATLRERRRFIRSETGGATGQAKATVFDETEFHRNFVQPFIDVATRVGFPKRATWLWVGPSGPHIIGRAAQALAHAMDASDPFSVDFDPRWFRRLAPGSVGRQRYLAHIAEQALQLIRREPIDVLFITPVVLDALIPHLIDDQRERIRGVHYGGISLSPDRYRQYRTQHFPGAVHLSGYGNSLFGCALEIPEDDERRAITYFPPHDGWVIQLVEPTTDLASPEPPMLVDIGQRGRVLSHRFSENHLILNLLERDEATRIHPHEAARRLGITADGLANPDVAPAVGNQISPGIY